MLNSLNDYTPLFTNIEHKTTPKTEQKKLDDGWPESVEEQVFSC